MRLSDKDFLKIYSRVPRLCVDLVIRNRQGVLLSKREIEPYKGFWHLPGGTVYFGESLAKAALRIAKEEAGLSVKVVEILGAMEFLEEIRLSNRHTVSVALLCLPKTSRLKGSWQAQSLAYFGKKPRPLIPAHARFLSAHGLLAK